MFVKLKKRMVHLREVWPDLLKITCVIIILLNFIYIYKRQPQYSFGETSKTFLNQKYSEEENNFGAVPVR